MKIKVEMYMDIDSTALDSIKKIEHHAEQLLDLENYPEIKSVYGVTVTKEKKEYRVSNVALNAKQINGNEDYDPFALRDVYVNGYIEAKNEEEAISIAIRCMSEEIRNNTDYDIETTDDEIRVYDYGKEIERHYDFEAIEVER